MSSWGREFMWSTEMASEGSTLGWLSRDAVPDQDEALALASAELSEPADQLSLVPVFCREESEVEARIYGHEWPLMVECTSRAKRPEPFWRIEYKQPVSGAERNG